jgi:DNA polymerase III delta prime subunit
MLVESVVVAKNQFLWTEIYRPKTVVDCILPEQMKTTFLKMQDKRDVPNLLLTGDSGCGKTTVARALLEFLGCDYVLINGSMKGNIDTLRNDIASFASSVSFKGTRKYVILDEADYLTHVTQPALRGFMEEFSRNCGFILTANYKNKIIKSLHSRCSVIDFVFEKKDLGNLRKQFYNRLKMILKTENIPFDKEVIGSVIKEFFPDCRRILNELQRYSVNGVIDAGILDQSKAASMKELVSYMKDKDYTSVRRWTTENLNNDQKIFTTFSEELTDQFTPNFIPALYIILARYQYQSAFVLDQEINFAACMAEIMVEASWR